MNRAAQPGGWKIANYYNQVQRTRRLAKTPGLGYRIRSYRQSAYFPSFAGNGASLSIGKAKVAGLSIVLIGLILGGIVLYQSPVFHPVCPVTPKEINSSSFPCGDPSTLLWHSTDPNNDEDEFNLRLTTDGVASLKMTPNSTDFALALSKSPMDLSTAISKTVYTVLAWTLDGGPVTNKVWGMYLSRNATLPSGASAHSYDPRLDASVAFLIEMFNSGGTTYNAKTFIQRQEIDTLAQEDPGGCAPAGSCFLSHSLSFDATAHIDFTIVYLNFTGGITGTCNAQGFGNGCSSSEIGYPTNVGYASNTLLPWLSLGGQHYYVGFFAERGIGTNAYFLNDSPSTPQTQMFWSIFSTYNPTIPPAPATIDTGGFFGPVIRAFINIGVFMLQTTILAFGFVASIIVTALNVMGK